MCNALETALAWGGKQPHRKSVEHSELSPLYSRQSSQLPCSRSATSSQQKPHCQLVSFHLAIHRSRSRCAASRLIVLPAQLHHGQHRLLARCPSKLLPIWI